MRKEDFIRELKNSFPSSQICEIASNVIVSAGDEQFELKKRFDERLENYITVPNLASNNSTEIDLSLINQKSIIVPLDILNYRAKKAYESYKSLL